MNLDEFKVSALRMARMEGLTQTNPVTRLLLGPTKEGFAATRRNLTVSYAQPALPPGNETFLWLNPATLEINKSTNWFRPATPTFKPVASYADMFFDSLDVASQIPDDIATQAYVNQILGQLQSQGAIPVQHVPVQNLTELRAVDVTAVPDKQVIFVEDENQIYAYDFQSSAVEDAYTVSPASGVGRWVLTGPAKLDGGSF